MAIHWTADYLKTASQLRGIEPNRTVVRRARNRLVQQHRAEFNQYVQEEKIAQGMNVWTPQ